MQRISGPVGASSQHAGYYVAGYGLGMSEEEWQHAVETIWLDIPESKPRFVCGVGGPLELLENVALGFDVLESRCVQLPDARLYHVPE
jgi:queuine tRNA-ribosyltransferase